jgi:xylose dehydrogenase (NAD/NADP)
MANRVRWGILSTSHHAASAFIPAVNASGSGEVAAVASRDAAKAQRYAAEHGIPDSYGSYEALLADPAIDAIYVPLPNSLHKEWAIRVAQAGKHCLCEKPLGLNAAEAEAMVAAFRAAGRKFAEAFQWRHHPQDQRVREMVRAGVIGDLRLIDGGLTFTLDRPGDIRFNPKVGGGALYDLGCYPISLARYITGQEPVAVTAQAVWGKTGVDDAIVATLEFPGGVLAHFHGSFAMPGRRYYEVVGTTGSLLAEHAYNLRLDPPGRIIRRGDDLVVVETIEFEPQNSYTLQVQDFNRAVLEDREPLFPAEDAIGNMRAIDAIYQAARTGRTVRL